MTDEVTQLFDCRFRASAGEYLVCLHCNSHTARIVPADCMTCIIKDWQCEHAQQLPTAKQVADRVAAVRASNGIAPPPTTPRDWNFLRELKSFRDDGFSTVTRKQYKARLKVCKTCTTRVGAVCSKKRGGCGCVIPLKAAGRVFDCPLGKWPKNFPNSA